MSFTLLSKLYRATRLLIERLLLYNPDTFCNVNVITPALCATFSTYGVFKPTVEATGSTSELNQFQFNLAGVFADTNKPQPRYELISLYMSPTKRRHVPAPPVTVKLISICQLARDAISGNSYVVRVGMVIAPPPPPPPVVAVEYTIFVVAVALLLIVATAELMAYENAPILFELGSTNENDASARV